MSFDWKSLPLAIAGSIANGIAGIMGITTDAFFSINDSRKSLEQAKSKNNIIYIPLLYQNGLPDDIVEKVANMIEKLEAEKIRIFFRNYGTMVSTNVKRALDSLQNPFYESETYLSNKEYFDSILLEDDKINKDLDAKSITNKFNATFIDIDVKVAGATGSSKETIRKVSVGVKVLPYGIDEEEIYSAFKYRIYNSKLLFNLIKVYKGEKSIKALFTESDRNNLEANFTKIMAKTWTERIMGSDYPANMLITHDLADKVKDASVDIYDNHQYYNLCKKIGLLNLIVINQSAMYFDLFESDAFTYKRIGVKKLLDPTLNDKSEITIKI